VGGERGSDQEGRVSVHHVVVTRKQGSAGVTCACGEVGNVLVVKDLDVLGSVNGARGFFI
jgi:hypothetical protein